MKNWIIKENRVGKEIKEILTKFGESLKKETHQKLSYNIDANLIGDSLSFSFYVLYKRKIDLNQFDLSIFDTGTEVFLFTVEYKLSENYITYIHSNSNNEFLSNGKYTYNSLSLLKFLDKVITSKETINIISNLLFLSSETASFAERKPYVYLPDPDIEKITNAGNNCT